MQVCKLTVPEYLLYEEERRVLWLENGGSLHTLVSKHEPYIGFNKAFSPADLKNTS